MRGLAWQLVPFCGAPVVVWQVLPPVTVTQVRVPLQMLPSSQLFGLCVHSNLHAVVQPLPGT